MSLFTGVSIIADGELCTTSPIDAGTDNGYHLLLIQGYSSTKEEIPTGESIDSGVLLVGGHQWRIEYYPNGVDPSCADFISLYLHLVTDEDVQLTVEAYFNICFADEVEQQKHMYIRACTNKCRFSNEDPCWGRNLVRRDALERSTNLKGDCFTIRCDIMVCKDPDTSRHAAEALMSDIGQHFNNLLENNVGADVTFKVGGEMFDAHRCVLAARSTVFMAQLFGPMKEGTTSSVIQIKDMDAKVYRTVLIFIYTGSFFDVEEDEVEEGQDEEKEVEYVIWLQDLFVAADIYDIQRLKRLCEEHLCKKIGVRSVASTLALAEQHYSHRLKEACLKFIQVQSAPSLEKVMAAHDWKHIRAIYPSLMNEITVKACIQLEEGQEEEVLEDVTWLQWLQDSK
jgi:speckle-type POZ protein